MVRNGLVLCAAVLAAVSLRGAAPDMVRIPAGEFQMGSDQDGEKPRHLVRVPSFELARTEVSVRQFRAFTEATGYRTEAEREGTAWLWRGPQEPGASWRSRGYWSDSKGVSWRNPGFTQSDDDPVVAISWQDAVEFCKWLSRETGQEYRLPSEAEWEYAARAGAQTEGPADPDQVAWYRDNSEAGTHPVARKKPNAWGLYDMLGNAWEWVTDVWSRDYSGAPVDGSPRLDGGTAWGIFAAGELRPLRGGAWGLERAELRYAGRPQFGLHQRCTNSGFRVARSLAPTAPVRAGPAGSPRP